MTYYSGVILKCEYDGHVTIPWDQVDTSRSRDNDIMVSIVRPDYIQTTHIHTIENVLFSWSRSNYLFKKWPTQESTQFWIAAIGPPGAWLDTPDYSKSVAI